MNAITLALRKKRQSLPNMKQSLSERLFPRYWRRLLLALLLLHLDEDLRNGVAARRLGLAPGTLNCELARLANAALHADRLSVSRRNSNGT